MRWAWIAVGLVLVVVFAPWQLVLACGWLALEPLLFLLADKVLR